MHSGTECGPAGASTAARELVIDEQHAGQRIDNFLLSRLKGLPRTRVYRILRRGEVRVNKGRIRQHYRLKRGDVVRIPPLRLAAPSARPAPDALKNLVESRILYEDRGLLVLDKPSGVAVHGGSGRSHGVIEALRASRGERQALELVHRLDRETSGCLLIAKRRAVLTALHGAFRRRSVEKRYLVLVRGRWRGGARSVDAALQKNVLRSGERVVGVDPEGKAGRTRFVPLVAGAAASLVRALPFTGRTHQIRVHAASLGHPIAGDVKYGDKAFNRRMRAQGLQRLFLHASELRFENPLDGTPLAVSAPLPEELGALLERLDLAWAG